MSLHSLSLVYYLFLQFILVFTVAARAETIVVHTDNQMDFQYFLGESKVAPSLTAYSNKIVLAALNISVVYEYMPFKRTQKLLESGSQLCALDKLATEERRKSYLFSYFMNVFISRQLYQQDYLPKLQEERIDLFELFKSSPRHKILLTSQINYGDSLEKQISKISKGQRVFREASEHEKGMVDMFASGRGEYALFYPQGLSELGVTLDARSYEVKYTTPYITGHLMCANDPKLYRVIERLNIVLQQFYQSGQLMNMHSEHILEPENKIRLAKYFQEAIAATKAFSIRAN